MQEAMQAGDTDVVNSVHCVAHELGGDDGLFSDREIGRARACNEYRALSVWNLALAEA